MWEDGLGLGRDVKEGIWKAREGIRARAKYVFIPGTCDKWVAGSNDGQHARASVGKEYLATHSFPHTLSTMAHVVLVNHARTH